MIQLRERNESVLALHTNKRYEEVLESQIRTNFLCMIPNSRHIWVPSQIQTLTLWPSSGIRRQERKEIRRSNGTFVGNDAVRTSIDDGTNLRQPKNMKKQQKDIKYSLLFMSSNQLITITLRIRFQYQHCCHHEVYVGVNTTYSKQKDYKKHMYSNIFSV